MPADDELASLSSGNSVDVFETDIEAWVEVPFEGQGWVAFDAGPPDDQTDEVEDGTSEAEAESLTANPPPPVTSTTSTTIPEAEEEEQEPDEEPDEAGGIPTIALAAGIALATPILLFGIFAALVLALKGRRRSRRRKAATPAASVHGAYREYVDKAIDTGTTVTSSTPRSSILELSEDEFDPTLRSGSLITLVEDAAFGAGQPEAGVVDAAWEHSESLSGRLGADLSAIEKLKAAISLRSLRAKETS